MPDFDIGAGDSGSFVDKRRGRGLTGADVLAETSYGNIAAMKARLTALNSTAYTPARLNTMTDNDTTYALRLASADNAGI